MKGKCRIHGSSRWLSLDNRDIKHVLPQERRDDFFVEGLDLSKTVIKYTGISNIGKHFFKKLFAQNISWFNLSRTLFPFKNAVYEELSFG